MPGLLVLGAGVRALRFAAPFHWPWHSDAVESAIPALQVVAGALPTGAGKEYFGAPPPDAQALE